MPHIVYQNHVIATAETTKAIADFVYGIASKRFNLFPSRLRLFDFTNLERSIIAIYSSTIWLTVANSHQLCCAISYIHLHLCNRRGEINFIPYIQLQEEVTSQRLQVRIMTDTN